ncbi:glycoside hydrolase family 32 protein [Rheinheimera sp. UJ63]|uniref:glycoside hydrolase family 32 protein n=1 Tax=Rheinheimera sp. UJ63 TaxID=2910157 RepID=UPI0022A80C64|nr:glycoside hydrolase family 32 protein [Rheinheimera sp. UJ63]
MKPLLFVFSLLLLNACSLQSSTYVEPFRPQFHFSPQQNWLNDPNGMFYYQGEYHLFYQYHPYGNNWGPMYWGHAVSQDLVHWQELPIALAPDEKGMIFSGSAVVDWHNTSGFGSAENPPIVAMFTYHDQALASNNVIAHQSQAIAYSLDKGRTWTKYTGNPVIANPGMLDFRDPKVVWDDEHQQWVMVLAQKDHIGFYTSPNLKDWQHVSDFGQEHGVHGGVWECPDLIKLKIDGSDNYRYALLVSINPGGPNGGSATQYFVGDWNGQAFILDAEQATTLAVKPAVFPAGELIEGFEQGFTQWTVSGEAFLDTPTKGNHKGQWPVSGFVGDYLANSFSAGDLPQGQLLSAPFNIANNYINFYVAGGYEPDKVAVQLLIDGEVMRQAGGLHTNNFIVHSWSVTDLLGKTAQLRILDLSSGPWGFIMVDEITQSEKPAENAQEQALWLDWGTDNYAGVTFANTTEVSSNPIFMGWMSNWDYARDLPTQPWRGAMTLPRELGLLETNQGLRVTSKPVAQLEQLVSEARPFSIAAAKDTTVSLPTTQGAKITLGFTHPNEAAFTLVFKNNTEQLILEYNALEQSVTLDRSAAGLAIANEKFNPIIKMPLTTKLSSGAAEIWLDTSAIEVFIGEGEYVLTSQVFPTSAYSELVVINSSLQSSLSLSVQTVDSIWQKHTH